MDYSNQWDEVATQAGYKTAASAREVYRVMAKKFGWNAGTGSTPNNHNNNKAGASGPTPTKVQKNTGKVGTKRRVRPRKELATGNSLLLYSKKQTEEDDDDDEEEDREEEAVKKKIKLEASDGDEPQLPFTHTAGSLGLDDWEDLGV